MNAFPNPSPFASTGYGNPGRAQLPRDITWDRPVFRPPGLPNPRVIFDPLPFMKHRLSAHSRQLLGH
jgi:hypothetical protein